MNQETNDRIKARIRKLLDVKEGSASEGEIENAMRMAAELMDKHSLEEADVMAADPAAAMNRKRPMGTADAFGGATGWTTWECQLCNAIMTLVGTVGSYLARDAETVRGAFKAVKTGKGYRFFGPAEDAQLAAELFEDWAHVIATLAVGKFGGCYRGDGAQYANGFANGLYRNAAAAAADRNRMVTASTMALTANGRSDSALVHVPSAERSLGALIRAQKDEADRWLKTEQKVKLSKSGGSGRYDGGSRDAFAAGRNDGQNAEFTAKRKPKLT